MSLNPPKGPLRQLTRRQSSDVTVYRDDGSGSKSYDDTTNYVELGTRRIFLFNPSERPVQTEAGEIHMGGLGGFALPSVDIEEDDRFDYGADRYEVDTITPLPNEADITVNEIRASTV